MSKKDGINKAAFKVKLSKMPPLSHWPDRTKEYSVTNSEVCQWMVAQEEVLQFLFDRAQATQMIEFDSQSKKWKGADAAEPTKPPSL